MTDTEITIKTPTLTDEMSKGIEDLQSWAATVAVTNEDERAAAMECGKSAKDRKSSIVAWFKPSKSAAHAAHKAISAQEKSLTDALDVIMGAAKKAIIGYDQEQEAIRLAAQRKQQAEAEEAARKERLRLEKAAEKLKTPELKEQRLEEAAMVTPVLVDVVPVVKREGESTSVIWYAEVVDEDLVPREHLIVDAQALNKLAVATKGKIKIPGVEFRTKKQLALR